MSRSTSTTRDWIWHLPSISFEPRTALPLVELRTVRKKNLLSLITASLYLSVYNFSLNSDTNRYSKFIYRASLICIQFSILISLSVRQSRYVICMFILIFITSSNTHYKLLSMAQCNINIENWFTFSLSFQNLNKLVIQKLYWLKLIFIRSKKRTLD